MQYKALVDSNLFDFAEEIVKNDCGAIVAKEKLELVEAMTEYDFILRNDKVIAKFIWEFRDDDMPKEFQKFNPKNATIEKYRRVIAVLKKFSEENKAVIGVFV